MSGRCVLGVGESPDMTKRRPQSQPGERGVSTSGNCHPHTGRDQGSHRQAHRWEAYQHNKE